MRHGVLHLWWGTGVRFKKKNMFEKKHHFTMLLGLWMLMVCSPMFFFIWTIYWDLLISLILEDLQVVFEELDREYLVSKVIQGGLVLEILRNPGRLGKKPWKIPSFFVWVVTTQICFFSFSPWKLLGTSRQRLSEIETWIKVEVPWGDLNLHTLYEPLNLCVVYI